MVSARPELQLHNVPSTPPSFNFIARVQDGSLWSAAEVGAGHLKELLLEVYAMVENGDEVREYCCMRQSISGCISYDIPLLFTHYLC